MTSPAEGVSGAREQAPDAPSEQELAACLKVLQGLARRPALCTGERHYGAVCAEAARLLRAVREQQKRWGSCDARGTLRINWRIVQAPIRLIEYVLLHELAHLKHRSHDRAFWNAVRLWLPDCDARRLGLRVLGPQLVW